MSSRQPLPGTPRPRVLVVAEELPDGTTSGGELRLLRICQLLAEQASVVVVADTRSGSPERRRRAAALRAAGIHAVTTGGVAGVGRATASRDFDTVLLESWFVAERVIGTIRARRPEARVIIDTVDLEFVRNERAGPVGGLRPHDHAARRDREVRTYRQADGLVFVSEEERALARATIGRAIDDWVIPIISVPGVRHRRRRDDTVAFVGNFWHAPNLDAAQWFCRDVWPRVLLHRPDARLVVAGAHSLDELRPEAAMPGVHVCGSVEDLGPVFDDARVVIAPLRFGAGMKSKVCEALAAGMPVVSTTIGAEGIDVRPGAHLVVADDEAAFAEAVVRLLVDDTAARRLGTAGRRAVLRQTGAAAVRPVVHALLAPGTGPAVRTPLATGLGWRAADAATDLRFLLRGVRRRLRAATTSRVRGRCWSPRG